MSDQATVTPKPSETDAARRGVAGSAPRTSTPGAGSGRPPPKRRLRPLFIMPLAILAAAFGGLGYWLLGRPTPIRYVTAAAMRGPIAVSVSASGTVNPVLTIIVGSYVSGVIKGLYCDYNTEVKKGQVCAKIDPRPYQTAVDQAKANVAVARAQLVKDQANLAYAKTVYARDLRLSTRGVVPQATVDSDKSALDQAAAQIVLDRAEIQQKEASLQAAEVNLGYTDITSPVDGTVVSRNVTIGQTVAASFQTPTLFLIATDLTKMQVDTNVSEGDIGAVKAGDKASFTVEAFPTRRFVGQVVQVRQAPQTVQNVITYDVVVGVDNAALLLKPGMTATAQIITARKDDVLRVPDQALRFLPPDAPPAAPGQSRVWILRDGKPVAVPVTIGLDDDSYAEIAAGDLKPGDMVILGEARSDAAAATMPASAFSGVRR